MIIKIVCAGVSGFKNLYRPDPDEFLIGVDGGIYHIIEQGLNVDLAVGDFDSCDIAEVVWHCAKVKRYPADKDESDLELAVRDAVAMDAERIEIYDATGGRIDHFLAALNVIMAYSDYPIVMFDERNRVYVIKGEAVIKKEQYKYCSFFALEDGAEITLEGFKYPLTSHPLRPFDNLCLSNEIAGEAGVVRVNGKKVLVIETS
ncbi:MAG TPA: thiamine diphosphokinase [Acholeplasmataceae bacterium]|jgi:thiamine pyrophosphokinase|nr:thiamine diphosphokinase [Acholeplasmataceae bacterium]